MDITAWLNVLRGAIVGIVSAILTYLTPVYDILFCILLTFAGNFFWGYVAGMVTQNDSFCLKKAKVALYEALTYASLIAVLFTIGEKMKNPQLALKSLSWVTWVWVYFYLINILKNLKRIFPKSRGIAFLYYVLSLEFIKNIPYAKGFLEQEKSEQNENPI